MTSDSDHYEALYARRRRYATLSVLAAVYLTWHYVGSSDMYVTLLTVDWVWFLTGGGTAIDLLIAGLILLFVVSAPFLLIVPLVTFVRTHKDLKEFGPSRISYDLEDGEPIL